MAHILDGEWRSFTIKTGDTTEDGTFHIEVDPSNNKLEPKSKHDGVAITGEVGTGKNFHHFFANKEVPRRNYRGFLLLNGPTMIMVGILTLNPSDLFEQLRKEDLSEEKLASLFQQQQEIWIATKP